MHRRTARDVLSLKPKIVFTAGEKPFACSVCGKRFVETGAVNKHKASVHSNTKAHQCHKCHKAYKVD